MIIRVSSELLPWLKITKFIGFLVSQGSFLALEKIFAELSYGVRNLAEYLHFICSHDT